MASTNCLAGCIGGFLRERLDLPGPAGDQGESFAPWCWVQLGEGASKITVGNESFSGDPNTAIVKSMEVGWVDTPSIKVEIVDEAGGTLGAVADAVRKCVKDVGVGGEMFFQWGWVISDCRSSKPRIVSSRTFRCIILEFEVNYSEGKIKYIIEGAAKDKPYEVERRDEIVGDDKYPADIEQAIQKLCSENPSCSVRYMERQPDGQLKDVKFEWARVKDPPKATWQTDNLSRISIIMKWLGAFRIKDGKCDKGIIPFFSPDKPDELILLKDPMPGPGEAVGRRGGGFGTYIVNGGKCSSVIEFTPKVNILGKINSFGAGGDTSGPNKSTNQFVEDKRCDHQKKQGPNAGTQMQATITQQAFDSYGVKVANDENLKSEIAHNKAGMLKARHGLVEADLKILGDPRGNFTRPCPGLPVSVVVINPFHLRGKRCGDWLAYPGCNEIFSNANWLVEGVNHTISPGTYTTTLKLTLAENTDFSISSMEPIGGVDSGGVPWKGGCE
jgi:hypothetical protein